MEVKNEFVKNRVEILADLLSDIFDKNVFDDSIENTALRVLKFWNEFNGNGDPDFPFTTFEASSKQVIVVDNIEFTSLCAHHLLPFYGVTHVGYLPNKLQVGLSKIPRLVRHYAKRPQVQEQLTEQVAAYLKKAVDAQGVMVIVEARHTCMSCRGVRAHRAAMKTSTVKGVFLSNPHIRNEVFQLIGSSSL